jgi:hypothetical protein
MQFYTLFHLNLMYSSLEESQRKTVIQSCYWPLLRLCDTLNWPIGIELTGLTLSYIQALDPEWVGEFKRLVSEKKCELIGSGYSQIIGPLVPAEVNDWNQKLGLDLYKKYLGIRPTIALVNEMAYAPGLIQHYLNHNYTAIIMEWNNPYSIHHNWDPAWQYYPQLACNHDNQEIPIIWANSIAFQKFQRYAHGDLSLNRYMDYVNHVGDGYFPLYSNDAEVFNFRMHRFATEGTVALNEWDRIAEAIQLIMKDHTGVLPSDVLVGLNHTLGGQSLMLGTPQQPIVVKKQEKYNINRWALTGRDDLKLNTTCYQLYQDLCHRNEQDPEAWQQLCWYWSSDFRTHITESRWRGLSEHVTKSLAKITNNSETTPRALMTAMTVQSDSEHITIVNPMYHLKLNPKKGLTIQSLTVKDCPLIGMIDHGYYDNIALGADFFSGHTIIEQPGRHKQTDLVSVKPVIDQFNHCVRISAEVSISDAIQESIQISCEDSAVVLTKTLTLPMRFLARIHLFSFTLMPDAWNYNRFMFKTHNGGNLETYSLEDADRVHHSEALSTLISAKHGLGATQGVVVLDDTHNQIVFRHDPAKSALIPTLLFQESIHGQYFCRLHYSAQEFDETFRVNSNESVTVSGSIRLELA